MQILIAATSPASANLMAFAVILPAASFNSSSLASVVLFFDPFFRPGLPGLKGFPRIGFALLRGAGVSVVASSGGVGSFVTVSRPSVWLDVDVENQQATSR